MGVSVTNCKKCNKIFQQIRQPYCLDCAKIEEEKFSGLYRMLQNSANQGGMSIDALAEQSNTPVETIEKYFVEGSFGTAGIYLHIHCQACGAQCNANQRLGRYCVPCSEITASKAGVEVQNLRDLNKRHADAERRMQQAIMLQENQAKRSNYSKFGNALKQC